MTLQNEWLNVNFRQRELTSTHRPLEDEFSFYEAVKNGDVEFVRRNCNENEFSKAAAASVLSDKPLQNMRYHFITTAAMVTRFCVEGGMEHELAYGLSDFYISKMDRMHTEKDIVTLHHTMVMDYTEKMHDLKKRPDLSKVIKVSIDYIFLHLHNRITLEELAENAGVSAGYLSRLFKKELDISVSDYICSQKLESAKNLLKYSNLSIVEIAEYLSFASQSYFIQVFRKKTGMTPKKYRDRFFQGDQSYTWKPDRT